jgi:GLPGLI family protein
VLLSPRDTAAAVQKGNDSVAKIINTQATSTNFMDQWELPKEKVVTAWHTPDIPLPHGPGDYWGLPDLILEVNDGKPVSCSSTGFSTFRP